ncbi:MAG: terminase small subunit, partial [Candidatus Nanoarchaeia archaeon]|nr:terminase small subunit [Candidatus Nanoarchaeia archaeon]
MRDKLTIKQEKYAQGLFTGLSQREAYKQAYDCENMTDKTIDEAACRLAGDSKMVARLEELDDELKLRNMTTVERVLAEYAKLGFADIKDYLSYKTAKTVVDHDDTGKPIIGYRQIVDAIDSDEVDGAVIQEVSIGKDGTFKFKLHDKKTALDSMAKYLGMFTDKVEVDNKVTVGFEQSLL